MSLVCFRQPPPPCLGIKIVLEILKEEKSIGELAAEHGLSPNQLRNWKKEFLENADKVFSESKQEKELRA
ncbi:MAG: transposase, partial [Dethiobacter sp.]|nr:transposase [Dethiobacter sp.]